MRTAKLHSTVVTRLPFCVNLFALVKVYLHWIKKNQKSIFLWFTKLLWFSGFTDNFFIIKLLKQENKTTDEQRIEGNRENEKTTCSKKASAQDATNIVKYIPNDLRKSRKSVVVLGDNMTK